MTSKPALEYTVRERRSHWVITYAAMASPCEILVRSNNKSEVQHLASLSFLETRRIEQKFSRYRDDNLVHTINHSGEVPVEVDTELAGLLDYADECFRLSDGLFDITSGVLQSAWTFDGASATPDPVQIESLRKRVGWNQVAWDGRRVCLPHGFQIDLGGIVKEYAADLVADRLFGQCGVSLMVNLGGDIRAVMSEGDRMPWIVGIEDPEASNRAVGEVQLADGGVATSGDVHRYCLVDGVRMPHILDPRTGWPVADAPRSVTVLGQHCVEAGFLATLAMLHGADAESFLNAQGADYHCSR